MEHEVKKGELHIRDLKMRLAHEIVSIYHDPKQAEEAQDHFIRVFQKKDTPDDMPEYKLIKKMNLVDFMAARDLCSSKSEARRLIKQRAVRFDGQLIESPDFLLKDPGVLRVGKRRFIRLI
jgi:tyrosyl-tRNA synthetase